MSYRDAMAKRITGDRDALNRRRKLWEEVASAYEKEGEDGVKFVVTKRSSSIAEEFNKLLERLEDRLGTKE